MKKSIFIPILSGLIAVTFVAFTATAQTTDNQANSNGKTESRMIGTKTQDNGTETAKATSSADNSETAQTKLENCPLKGTADCPLVKNCPKKGTADCPYKTTASSDNSTTAKSCCKGKKASCCAKK